MQGREGEGEQFLLRKRLLPHFRSLNSRDGSPISPFLLRRGVAHGGVSTGITAATQNPPNCRTKYVASFKGPFFICLRRPCHYVLLLFHLSTILYIIRLTDVHHDSYFYMRGEPSTHDPVDTLKRRGFCRLLSRESN